MTRPTLLAAALLTMAAAGCSDGGAASSAPAPLLDHAVTGARPALVFFMNPHGRPCQMQDEILRSMPDLASRVEVVRVKTTEPADLPRFERYGIRSLPQLLVVDPSGAVLRRPTPGILSAPQILQLVAP